ncbi:MAG TPA: hypothetical protein VN327_05665, partial [Pseudonocardiaceae bacterium]|nr:hypothetical protein [Pseudonocardiaceae bacterium]
AAHDAAGAVATAMTNAARIPAAEQPSVAALTARVDQAWTLWHRSDAHRTAVAIVLPDLLTTAHAASRALTGDHRRAALAEQARVYHLAQLFFAFQPARSIRPAPPGTTHHPHQLQHRHDHTPLRADARGATLKASMRR